MSSTSQKHKDFVGEPMGEKDIKEVAGIGDVLGKRFTDIGYDKAYVLLGQFLLLKKDEDLYISWMKDEVKANKKQAGDSYNCLQQWCDAFL